MDAKPTTAKAFVSAFAILTIWAALADVPFFRLEGPDDAFYLEVGHLWARGLPPYLAAFDVKPPGFFALLALVDVVVGPHLETLRAIAVLFTALAATALYFLARDAAGRPAGVLCAVLYPVVFEIYGDAAYAPLCALTIVAFLAALSRAPLLARAAMSGLAIGAAATVKQTAALAALALLVVLLRAADAPNRRAGAAAAFVGAASLPPLAFLAYFAAIGAVVPLLTDVVALALNRPTSAAESITFWQGFARLAYLQAPLLPITVAAVAGLFGRSERTNAIPIGAIALWLAAEVVALLAQHAISPYYLTPALAPLLLLAAIGLTKIPDAGKSWMGVAKPALFGAVAIVAVTALRGAHVVSHALAADDRATLGAKAAIESTRPDPTDRLLVVSRGGLIYGASGLDPPTPYYEWAQTLCDFPGAGLPRLAEAIASRPRYLVVADRSKRYPCEQDSQWALVDDALRTSYRLLARADGDYDFYEVYQRK
ncbi:MAG: glycosyltransferase family 39 protein [Roseiarcus sp.]